MSASDTPRTDAAKTAFYATDSLSTLWEAFSGVEIERNKAIELYEDLGSRFIDLERNHGRLSVLSVQLARESASMQAAIASKDATIARLRALVQDAYDDPDSEILGTDWNNAAQAALTQE